MFRRMNNSIPIRPELPGNLKQYICEMFLHAADIGNPCLEMEQALKWKDMIIMEFMEQGKQEQALGLPVTPFMIGLEEVMAQAKSQLGFINFVVGPFYEVGDSRRIGDWRRRKEY
jgi:hypothetical protein